VYTAEEVQAAVSKLVQTTVSTPADQLGVRRSDVTFSSLQEAAAGVFVLFADAPFYVAHLAARRIAEQVQDAQETLDALLDASEALGRLVTPIEDISGLGNAQVALQDLGSAVAARTTGFRDLDNVSAFRRYVAGLGSFLDQYGSNIKQGGEVVDTPQSARDKLAGLYRELVTQYQELVRTVTFLHDAIDDFSALHLPQVIANGVIGRAQGVLDDYIGTLGAQTPEERLEGLRALVLDLLAQQTVVRQYGGALAPSRYLNVTGPLTPYSDDTHAATPARLPATKPGPYITFAGQDTIQIALDGAATYTPFTLPRGVVAELDGQVSEPYVVDTANNLIQYATETRLANDPMLIGIPVGTDQASDIVAAVVASPVAGLSLTTYPRPLKIDSLWNTNALGNFTVANPPLNPADFGVRVGDLIDVLDGPSSGLTFQIISVLLDGFVVSGSGLTDATGVHAQVRAPKLALRWSLTNAEEALTSRRGIALDGSNVPQVEAGLTTIGFFPGMRVRSQPIVARDIKTYADPIYQSPKVEVAKVLALDGRGRALESDAGKIQYYAGAYRGDLDGTFANVITISNIFILDGREPQVGDRILIREGADVGTIWTVTVVTPLGVVTATGSGTATTAASVAFDGAPFLTPDLGWYATILDGPNNGDYPIADQPGPNQIPNQSTPDVLTLGLARALPVPRLATEIATFGLTLTQEVPVFVSPSATVASEVRVQDSVTAELLFGPIPPP
jgi:hypothetical protein